MSLEISNKPLHYCGRNFTGEEIEQISNLIAGEPKRNRVQLSRQICEEFAWRRPDGRLKEMSCRVALLRMERNGLITLPPPQKGNGNGRNRPRLTTASEPREPLSLPAEDLGELSFRIPDTPKDSSLWNELIERYHYLGYTPLAGAQIRYLVFTGPHLVAALSFGAAAWKLAPRDLFIGWTVPRRISHLHLVVNNARFLILPWVRSQNLASRILGAVTKRLAPDWQDRYGYPPVLCETIFEQNRFRGTCYRAANWIHVGQTQGRGKLDRNHRHLLPVKDIFLYPLHKHFRQKLCSSN